MRPYAIAYSGQEMEYVSEGAGGRDWGKGWGEGDPLMKSFITPINDS